MSPLLEQAINEIKKLSDEEQTAIAQFILRQLQNPVYSHAELFEMPLAQRRQILAQQAEMMISHYQNNEEILEWSGGDIVELEDAMS